MVRLTWKPSGRLPVSASGQSPHLTFWAVLPAAALTFMLATLVPAVAITRKTGTVAAE